MKNASQTTTEKTFTVNEIGAILEKMDGKIETLAEVMEIKFENVNARFDGIDVRLDGIDNRLDLVETKIDRLQDDMVEVKFELKRKVDAEEFERLEKRVVKLENLSLSHQS
ncbi:MAG: hypothetical protein PHW24_00405 [Candidatus Moranbacteria bacterium]|nr:hypothetical protein [Candidatus Moranbacteria bacterium]